MSMLTWFTGWLLMTWVIGYAVGSIFLNLRKFIDKCK